MDLGVCHTHKKGQHIIVVLGVCHKNKRASTLLWLWVYAPKLKGRHIIVVVGVCHKNGEKRPVHYCSFGCMSQNEKGRHVVALGICQN